MLRQFLPLILLLVAIVCCTSEVQAKPLHQSPVIVVVCYDQQSCTQPNPPNDSEIMALDHYTEQVLANEWPSDADMEAFKAGAIGIRTFTYRQPGCGAYVNDYIEGSSSYRVLSNRSQAYRYGERWGSQKDVTNNHTNAESQTRNTVLVRSSDGVAACAKYKSDTGNPTADDGSGEDANTLLSVPDPVDSNNPVFESNPHRSGMSQNGTVVWRQGAAGVRWNYCQMLSHYYANIEIYGCGDEEYWWVWLDVGNTIVYDGIDVYSGGRLVGGDEYYGPVFNAPDTMEVGQSYSFGIHLQNTGTATWQQSGSGRTQVGLYWDDNRGSAQFSDLDETMDPGEDDSVQVNVSPPSEGTHCLTADLIRNGNWFSDQSSPTWPVLHKCLNIVSPDTTPPSNPNNLDSNSSHTPNNWSGDNTVYAEWSGARDDRTSSGQLVYSVEWTTSSSTVPDAGVDETDANAAGPVLPDGSWWLHVRTRDQAGNWADGAAHFGPFLIDTAPPMGSHNAPDWYSDSNFTVSWNGMDASGVVFDFDYALNNGTYQDWFTGNALSGSRVYDRGANVNDFVHIRACLTDLVGHPASPPCTYSHTAIHITPYLNPDLSSLTTCFALADTAPQTGTVSIKNRGPGSLDWTAVAGQYLSLNPTSGTNVVSGFPGTFVYTLTNPAVVGQHTTAITVSSPTADVGNNPVVVPVSIRVAPDQCEYYLYLPTIYKTTP